MTIQFVLDVTAAPFIYLPLVAENLHHVVIFPLSSLGHMFKWRPFLSSLPMKGDSLKSRDSILIKNVVLSAV